MSTAPTSLSDTLPSSIPKLDASGLNWAIFAVRFQDAVEAKGFWGHFTGDKVRPADGDTPADPEKPITAEELAIAQRQWDKDELSAKSLLTQKIPDSTLMRVHAKRTVRERWEAIVVEYTEKGAYAQTDLRKQFLESKCPNRSNVRTFLDDLRVKREELASVGVKISEDDYRSTVINSLPYSLANFASSQLAAVPHPRKPLPLIFSFPSSPRSTSAKRTSVTRISAERGRKLTKPWQLAHLRHRGKEKEMRTGRRMSSRKELAGTVGKWVIGSSSARNRRDILMRRRREAVGAAEEMATRTRRPRVLRTL